MAFQSKETVLATYTPELMRTNPQKVREIWDALAESKGNYEKHTQVVLANMSILGHKGINYMILALSRGEIPHYLLDNHVPNQGTVPAVTSADDILKQMEWVRKFSK